MTQPTLFPESPTIQERFERFLVTNPSVYPEFVRIARELRSRGHTRYSADGIGHVLRWHRIMAGPMEDGFKINNVFTRCLARKAMVEWPELDGFFETRRIKS